MSEGTKASLQANEKKTFARRFDTAQKNERKKSFCLPFMQTNDYFENYST